MSLQKILQLEKYLVLQHLSKSEKFLTENNFKIICYFKFVGSWGGRIFGGQKDLWGFRGGSFSHQTCWKPPGLGNLSFAVFIWFSKGLPLVKGVPNYRGTCWALGNSLSDFFIYTVVSERGENELSQQYVRIISVTCWRMILCHANGRTQRSSKSFPSVICMTLAFSMR